MYYLREMPDKLTITVISGSVDRLTGMAVLVSGAVAMDVDVEIFLQLWGIYAFRKDKIRENTHLSEFEELGEEVMKRMVEKNVKPWHEVLKEAKELGNVKIYACSTAMDIWGVKLEDLEMVDDVIGAAEWIEKAKESNISIFV